jgi:hypothetical protein
MLFSDARAVTPNDSTVVGAAGFMVTGAGNISIVVKPAATPLVIAVLAGVQYGIPANIIRATGTTATGIVALYA